MMYLNFLQKISIRMAVMVAFGFMVLSIGGTLLSPHKAVAISGGDFNPGRIIDDSVFFGGTALSQQQIQQFLNAKVPTCDTNGLQPYNGTTRATYGTSKGYPPPYTCLKDYVTQTSYKSPDAYCSGNVAGLKSASQIIFEVGQSCGISQKVLLVLLQKEQSLVGDDWPWSSQYRSATGYGCPDTAPCDAEYYGFFNQVYAAARIYKYYAANSVQFNYRPNRNNFIAYNPNSSCGGSTIFIENQATAGLYIYTPYQPNQAALNNLYGVGDGCSAYGNRNFWRLFNDWFGSTTRLNGELIISSALSISDTSPRAGQRLTISYGVQNKGSYSIDTGILWICGDMNGKQFGGGSNRKTLAPGATMTLSMTYIPQEAGTLKLKACGNPPGGPGWVEGYPYAYYPDHRERSFTIR